MKKTVVDEKTLEELRNSVERLDYHFQICEEHCSDRDKIHFFDVQAMEWARTRHREPRSYIALIIKNLTAPGVSAEDLFANIVAASSLEELTASESAALLTALAKTGSPVGSVYPDDYPTSCYEDIHDAFEHFQYSFGGSVRPFITNLTRKNAHDAFTNLKLDSLTIPEIRRLYCLLILKLEQGITHEKIIAPHKQLKELVNKQDKQRKLFRLGEELIAGCYEPKLDSQGKTVMVIALSMLGISVEKHEKQQYRSLRPKVVAQLATLETACDDILSPIDRPDLKMITLQGNLYALFGEDIWQEEVIPALQILIFNQNKNSFSAEHPKIGILSEKRKERWTQLREAHRRGEEKKREEHVYASDDEEQPFVLDLGQIKYRPVFTNGRAR